MRNCSEPTRQETPSPLFRLRRLIVLTFAAVMVLGFSAREFAFALVWAARHHQLATLPQGTPVRVPLFWQPGSGNGAPDELRLHRANWGLRPSQEWVVLRTNTPPLLPDRQRQTLGSLIKRLNPAAPAPLPFSLPEDIRNSFQCLLPGVTQFPTWQLSCVSSDGSWAADLFGSPASQRDVPAVLRNLQPARRR